MKAKWPKPLVCDICGKETDSLARYAYGWGGAFNGGLYGPNVCDECAPPGTRAISFTTTVKVAVS